VAAFVLIAALAPTDDIAVISLGKRINIPPKIMNILTGESILNDASGIVSFQFAVLVAATGSFSMIEATGRFILIGLGGILAGLVFTFLKYLFLKWIRNLGMENITLHILIEILTPFIVYLLAEALQVSAILAIFSAGIAHSFNRKQLNPENATLNAASNSIWNVLSFTLEGLVFVILGAQLPDILRTLQMDVYPVSTSKIILVILTLTLVFTASRFLWSYCTIRRKNYADTTHNTSKLRASLIFALSGARGAVTLAIVMSIPVFINDTAFPQRDLLILIATGVIICSLLITNFVLPFFVEKTDPQTKSLEEKQACIEIFQNVIKTLSAQLNDDNKRASFKIVKEYISRISALQNKNLMNFRGNEDNRKIILQIYEWKIQHINEMYEKGEIDEFMISTYLSMQKRRFDIILKKSENPFKNIPKAFTIRRYARKFLFRYHKLKKYRSQIFATMQQSDQMILEKLNALRQTEQNPAIDKFIFYYDFSRSLQSSRTGRLQQTSQEEQDVKEVAEYAFQLERDQIRMMFEEGRISRETATEMRNNISLLMAQME
jgi:CPA1 family monovalent cation:H+ antiporter